MGRDMLSRIEHGSSALGSRVIHGDGLDRDAGRKNGKSTRALCHGWQQKKSRAGSERSQRKRSLDGTRGDLIELGDAQTARRSAGDSANSGAADDGRRWRTAA